MKMKKCPSCGAPVSGTVCAYCGQTFMEERQPGEKPSPPREAAPVTTEIQVIKPRRNALDLILIFIGAMWIFIILAAGFSIGIDSGATVAAILIAAAPGIILLLIGCRKKKHTVVKTIRGAK